MPANRNIDVLTHIIGYCSKIEKALGEEDLE